MISSLATFEHVAAIDHGPRPHKNKAAVIHRPVSSATDLKSGYENTSTGFGAHFYINEKGKLFQYVDSDNECWHAFDANSFAVGIEIWDGAKTPPPDMNQAQLDTLDALLRELGVPAQVLLPTPSDGVGYHCEYDEWNGNHHTCPDPNRIAQIPGIITRLGGDMTDDQAAQLSFINSVLNNLGESLVDGWVDGTPGNAKKLANALIPSWAGKTGPAGPQGAPGPKGDSAELAEGATLTVTQP